MNDKSILWWIVGITILVTSLFVWSRALQDSDPSILSRNGLHWHSELAMYIKGEKKEIPANIGLGVVHQPVHTHDDGDQGIIHMEFQGLVRKEDITLGQFFKSWGKDIRSFGGAMKMTVNGQENTEYENYIMQDKDKIELRYE